MNTHSSKSIAHSSSASNKETATLGITSMPSDKVDARVPLTRINIDYVDNHPGSPRLGMHEETVDALAAEMRATGYFRKSFAVIVRKKPDGRCEILSGSQRIEAARRAGLKEVWVFIIEATDDEAYMYLVLANTQEPYSFVETGLHAIKVVDENKSESISGYARRIGMKRENLSRYMKGARVLTSVRALVAADDLVHLRHKAEHLARIADAPKDMWPGLVQQMVDAEKLSHAWTVKATEAVVENLVSSPSTQTAQQDETDGPTVGPPESGTSLKGEATKAPTPKGGDKKGAADANKVVEVSLAIGGEPQRLPVDGKVVRVRVTGIQITREVLKSLYLGSESEGITEENGIISISIDELSAHRSPTITSGVVQIEVL